METPPILLATDHGSLGDQIAFLGAARQFARLHPESQVLCNNLPDIVRQYADGLLTCGESSSKITANPERRHRLKDSSGDFNYAGTYWAELGIPLEKPPAIELPAMPPPDGLIPKAYFCLQPYSGFAAGLDRDRVQEIIHLCRQVVPEWPVLVVGAKQTPRNLEAVDYSYLGDPSQMLQCVQHSGAVLTPRSASAHIASAYGVPTFVWTPEDGENWHLDYPDWPHGRASVDEPFESLCDKMARFLWFVKIGAIQSSSGIKKAAWRSGIENRSLYFQCEGRPSPKGLVDAGGYIPAPSLIRQIITQQKGVDPGPYPAYLNQGNAAEFILDEALTTCRGKGADIGPDQWPLPGAIPVRNEPQSNAYDLSGIGGASLDFVFSSHVLEHLERPEAALREWVRVLRAGGVLFLYLPHPAMHLWHPEGPWGGDHKWIPSPRQVRRLLEGLGLKIHIATEVPDAYWSFRCVATRG